MASGTSYCIRKSSSLILLRGNDYEYDRNRITATEGDTGPYLQYQCCRLFSVERKVAEQTKLRSDPTQINTDLLMDNDRAREIVLLLARYPDVVRKTFKNQEPNTIVTFSFKLCRAISSVCFRMGVSSFFF